MDIRRLVDILGGKVGEPRDGLCCVFVKEEHRDELIAILNAIANGDQLTDLERHFKQFEEGVSSGMIAAQARQLELADKLAGLVAGDHEKSTFTMLALEDYLESRK